jgi:O-acetyl-ADP-ribose deacetylase (regulator of RNase III)
MQGTLEPTGRARVTPAYNLPARFVIHTVGPIITAPQPTPEQEEQLASCYRACLQAAEEHGCRSLAFCCISTGEFHYPNDEAARIAVDVVRSYLEQSDSPMEVVFNVFKPVDYAIYRDLLVER